MEREWFIEEVEIGWEVDDWMDGIKAREREKESGRGKKQFVLFPISGSFDFV